jgi:hypothetical protein
MSAIAMAAASGALSILGGMAQNRAITKTATRQYNANKLFIERDQAVAYENLQFSGQEINNQLGMALTDLMYSANRQQAQQQAAQTEKNVYGNLAARQQAVMEMREELAADKLEQQAEAQMTAIQSNLTQAKYNAEAKHAQNAQAYNNMMSQRSSTLEIVSSAASSSMGTYFAAGGKL